MAKVQINYDTKSGDISIDVDGEKITSDVESVVIYPLMNPSPYDCACSTFYVTTCSDLGDGKKKRVSIYAADKTGEILHKDENPLDKVMAHFLKKDK